MKPGMLLLFTLLFSGCICSDALNSPGSSDERPLCNAPYIRFGAQCCLDQNANGICDADEAAVTSNPPTTEFTVPSFTIRETTSTTSTTQTPSTLYVHTTVTAAPTCDDGIQNQGEEYVDCGTPCPYCEIHALTSSYKDFQNTGYKFKFKEKIGTGANKQYWISVKTPDGLTDERPLSTGETFVDYLRVKVINYADDPDKPTVYLRYNTQDLQGLPAGAQMLSIGGRSCVQAAEGMCERSYAGYTLRMVSRIDDGARLEITEPGTDLAYKADIVEGRKTYAADHHLVVGGFFDRNHQMVGGYSLFYVYAV